MKECDNYYNDCNKKLTKNSIKVSGINGIEFSFCSIECLKNNMKNQYDKYEHLFDDSYVFKYEDTCICGNCFYKQQENILAQEYCSTIENKCDNCNKKFKKNIICISYEHYCSKKCFLEKNIRKK